MANKWWSWEPEEYRRVRDADDFKKWADEQDDTATPSWQRDDELDRSKVPPIGPRAAQWFERNSARQLNEWKQAMLGDRNESKPSTPKYEPPPPTPEMPKLELPDWAKGIMEGAEKTRRSFVAGVGGFGEQLGAGMEWAIRQDEAKRKREAAALPLTPVGRALTAIGIPAATGPVPFFPEAGKAMSDAQTEVARGLHESGKGIREANEIKDKPSWDVKGFGSLLDPEYLTTTGAETLGTAIPLMAIGIIASLATGGIATAAGIGTIGNILIGSVAGAALSRPLESLMEAGGTYKEALGEGKSEDEASDAASKVFLGNLGLGASDAAQFAMMLGTGGKLKLPFRQAVKNIASAPVKEAGKLAANVAMEGGEEVYQEALQQTAQGKEISPERLQEAGALGGLMGGAFHGGFRGAEALKQAAEKGELPKVGLTVEDVGGPQRFVASNEGMAKGYWKIIDTQTGNTVESGLTSKSAADKIARSMTPSDLRVSGAMPEPVGGQGKEPFDEGKGIPPVEKAEGSVAPPSLTMTGQARLEGGGVDMGGPPVQAQFGADLGKLEELEKKAADAKRAEEASAERARAKPLPGQGELFPEAEVGQLPARTTEGLTYDDLQKLIDTKEDELLAQDKSQAKWEAIQDNPELTALYERRDAVGTQELQSLRQNILANLPPGIDPTEAREILESVYSIYPPDSPVAMYMGSKYARSNFITPRGAAEAKENVAQRLWELWARQNNYDLEGVRGPYSGMGRSELAKLSTGFQKMADDFHQAVLEGLSTTTPGTEAPAEAETTPPAPVATPPVEPPVPSSAEVTPTPQEPEKPIEAGEGEPEVIMPLSLPEEAPGPLLEAGMPAEVLAAHTRMSAWKSHNSALAKSVLDKLEKQEFFVKDARDALKTYQEVDRTDFVEEDDYKESRDEAWQAFLDAVEGIEKAESEESIAPPLTVAQEPEPSTEQPAVEEKAAETTEPLIRETEPAPKREGAGDLLLGVKAEQLPMAQVAEQPEGETWQDALSARVAPEKKALEEEAANKRRADFKAWEDAQEGAKKEQAQKESDKKKSQDQDDAVRAATIAEIKKKAKGPTAEERAALPRNMDKAVFTVGDYDKTVEAVVEQFQHIPEAAIGGGAGTIPLYKRTPMQRAFEAAGTTPGAKVVAHYIDPVAASLGEARKGNPVAWVHAKRDLFVGLMAGAARESVAEWATRNQKLLGINSKGLATAVKVKPIAASLMPKGAAQRLDDIMENYKSYDLTVEQRAAFTEIEDTLAAILQAQLDEGIDVKEAKNYWPRIVTKSPKGADVTSTTKGHQQMRSFETIRDGLKLGFGYADPITALAERLTHGIENIANHRMSTEIKALGETEAQRFKNSAEGQQIIADWKQANTGYKNTVALQKAGMVTAQEVVDAGRDLERATRRLNREKKRIGKAHIGEQKDSWTGRIYPKEIADQLDKWRPSDPSLFDEWFRLERASMVTGDLSQVLVQGTNLFFAHPVIWWKAAAHAVVSLAKAPENYRTSNSVEIKDGIMAAAISPPTEFMLSEGGKLLKGIAKLPGIRQTQRAFEWWTFVAQTELWKAYKGSRLTGLERAETATHIRKATGVLLRAGLTTKEKGMDTSLLFAARFAGATTTMMTDALRGVPFHTRSPRVAEAQKQMGSIIAGGVALTIAVQWLLSRSLPNWDDPEKKDWGSISTNEGTISVFGPYHTYFKAFAQMGKAVAEGSSGKALEAATVLARGKASLRVGPLIDWMMGTTSTGFPVKTGPQGILDAYVLRVGPIGPKQIGEHVIKVAEGKNVPMPAVAGELAGLRTSPFTTAQRLRKLKDQLASNSFGKEWADISGNQEDTLRAKNPEIGRMEEHVRQEAARQEAASATGYSAPSGGGSSQRRREAAEAELGAGVTSETAKAWNKARPGLDEIKAKQAAWEKRLAEGKISGVEWRREDHRLQDEKRGLLKGVGLAFPEAAMTGERASKYKAAMATIAGTVPDRRERAEILADAYLSMTPALDEDGLEDMEDFFEQQEFFKASLSEGDREDLMAQISKEASPLRKRYYVARELMGEYMELPRYQGMSKEVGDEAAAAGRQLRALAQTVSPKAQNRTAVALRQLAKEQGRRVALLAQRSQRAKTSLARRRFRYEHGEELNRFYSDLLRAEQAPIYEAAS